MDLNHIGTGKVCLQRGYDVYFSCYFPCYVLEMSHYDQLHIIVEGLLQILWPYFGWKCFIVSKAIFTGVQKAAET